MTSQTWHRATEWLMAVITDSYWHDYYNILTGLFVPIKVTKCHLIILLGASYIWGIGYFVYLANWPKEVTPVEKPWGLGVWYNWCTDQKRSPLLRNTGNWVFCTTGVQTKVGNSCWETLGIGCFVQLVYWPWWVTPVEKPWGLGVMYNCRPKKHRD